MTSASYTLPNKGASPTEVLRRVEEFRASDPPFERGYMTAYCMTGSRELQAVSEQAYQKYYHQNAVVRRYLPGLRKMEEQVREIAANLLSGGTPGIRVNFTSGGSESLFCGIHAARQWARHRLPHITAPEIIAPYSAHASISKACHYLGLKLVRVQVGPDYRADANAMKAAIGPNTIALLGSAPSWPYGKVDPIADIAAAAHERGLWMHVDACVGGYLAPFVAKLGYPVPAWDFGVEGVSSVSADLHKYGYAPKPVSTIAFRSEELQTFHNVLASDWPSMGYMTEGVIGSRPGGAIAATWAVLHFLGEEGYLDYAKQTMNAKAYLEQGLKRLGMKPWDTDLCILLFETAELAAESVVGGLNEAGWMCMGTQRPPLVQLIIDPLAATIADDYLRDLAQVLTRLRSGKTTKKGDLGYTE